jgi:hypothetical protein
MPMKQELKSIQHKPRLDTILMVEDAIEKNSGEFTKFQLWRKLKKSVMYQTYSLILDYLEYSNKIAFDKNKKLGWIFSPDLYKKYKDRKDLSR